MPRHAGKSPRTAMAAALLLAGCATARFHSEEELATVGRDCGVALGELFQDESEKRLLFLMRPGATPQQRSLFENEGTT